MTFNDIDIRESSINIKFDEGQEEIDEEVIYSAITEKGRVIRITAFKGTDDSLVRIKIVKVD